jgi:hypothetical protein
MFEPLKSKLVPGKEFTHDQLIGCKDALINTIKELRSFTGFGLRESKDLVDAIKKTHPLPAQNAMSSIGGYNQPLTTLELDDIYKLFKQYSINTPDPLSKEEFLAILGDAIDAGDKLYYTDMIDVVEQTCKNIRKEGGLQKIAEKIHKFVDGL